MFIGPTMSNTKKYQQSSDESDTTESERNSVCGGISVKYSPLSRTNQDERENEYGIDQFKSLNNWENVGYYSQRVMGLKSRTGRNSTNVQCNVRLLKANEKFKKMLHEASMESGAVENYSVCTYGKADRKDSYESGITGIERTGKYVGGEIVDVSRLTEMSTDIRKYSNGESPFKKRYLDSCEGWHDKTIGLNSKACVTNSDQINQARTFANNHELPYLSENDNKTEDYLELDRRKINVSPGVKQAIKQLLHNVDNKNTFGKNDDAINRDRCYMAMKNVKQSVNTDEQCISAKTAINQEHSVVKEIRSPVGEYEIYLENYKPKNPNVNYSIQPEVVDSDIEGHDVLEAKRDTLNGDVKLEDNVSNRKCNVMNIKDIHEIVMHFENDKLTTKSKLTSNIDKTLTHTNIHEQIYNGKKITDQLGVKSTHSDKIMLKSRSYLKPSRIPVFVRNCSMTKCHNEKIEEIGLANSQKYIDCYPHSYKCDAEPGHIQLTRDKTTTGKHKWVSHNMKLNNMILKEDGLCFPIFSKCISTPRCTSNANHASKQDNYEFTQCKSNITPCDNNTAFNINLFDSGNFSDIGQKDDPQDEILNYYRTLTVINMTRRSMSANN